MYKSVNESYIEGRSYIQGTSVLKPDKTFGRQNRQNMCVDHGFCHGRCIVYELSWLTDLLTHTYVWLSSFTSLPLSGVNTHLFDYRSPQSIKKILTEDFTKQSRTRGVGWRTDQVTVEWTRFSLQTMVTETGENPGRGPNYRCPTDSKCHCLTDNTDVLRKTVRSDGNVWGYIRGVFVSFLKRLKSRRDLTCYHFLLSRFQ